MSTPAYRPPQYRDSNPKIDLYRADGSYVGSTNWHRTCREALAYMQDKNPEAGAVKARIDHRSR